MVAPFEPDAPRAKAIPTPTLSRGAIVIAAQNDVREIEERGRTGSIIGGDEGNHTYQENYYNVEFIVNKEKRTVVALVRYGAHKNFTKMVQHRGVAKCDPSDCFNEHIGKAIAVRRAFELDVPRGYLNAPEPEGREVGDIISSEIGNLRVVKDNKDVIVGKTCTPKSIYSTHGTVVDDTARYQD